MQLLSNDRRLARAPAEALRFPAGGAGATPLLADDAGIKHIYEGLINGYAGRFSEIVMHQLRSMPEVQYIEHDRVVHTMGSMDIMIQKGAPWLSLGTLGRYQYDPRGGEGVDVYVIDSGINIHHVEFEGRASWGKTVVCDDVDEDQNGHGTHCAGTIASRQYGVAKGARVIAVKVVRADGYGSMSDIIAGISYAASAAAVNAAAAQKGYAATGRTTHKGSVVNMSLGVRGVSRAANQAVDVAVVHFVSRQSSPASADKAITVGASTQNDERAYFSNHGPCVDVFAPGLNVPSTFKGAPDATASISGTSMASPHTAGLVAYLLGIYPSATFDSALALETPAPAAQSTFDVYTLLRAMLPRPFASLLPAVRPARADTLTPAQMKSALLGLATRGALSDLPAHTPNRLVFNNATEV
ncbi:peptidase S8/S53 domain-containing protein [Mycena rosella]|uniref:Peptidase S8/S53 domain-containing protein n=1 Tax=Mycena rosella TaxID=1033263 RepID=A0AAD7GP14_MYCRO|nr:peptidase S8/S53 domain-containing protein [Mycena rosella]